jgi:luciferase family oxidoreductase group 1
MRPLSILDLTPIEAGASSRQALTLSADLAVLADRLGYHRLWFAEHHNAAGLASGSPEIMIAHVAERTAHLRLGSGGVMLPNHAPLKIAETFRLLEALHPGRIDLGLGRAPGGDTRATLALRRTRDAVGADDYPERLAELLAYDDGTFPDGHPLQPVRAMPVDVGLPPLWLLGSSDFSAQLAAEVGLGFAFAAHIHAAGAVRALRAYRQQFVPSARYPEPRAILAVSVTVGETAEHARELSLVSDLILLRLRTGRLDTYPSLEEARAHQFTTDERALLATLPMSHLAGDPDAVRRQIEDLADRSQADEVMISTRLPGRADRERTIRSMARVFGLQERPTPVTGTAGGAG